MAGEAVAPTTTAGAWAVGAIVGMAAGAVSPAIPAGAAGTRTSARADEVVGAVVVAAASGLVDTVDG